MGPGSGRRPGSPLRCGRDDKGDPCAGGRGGASRRFALCAAAGMTSSSWLRTDVRESPEPVIAGLALGDVG